MAEDAQAFKLWVNVFTEIIEYAIVISDDKTWLIF
jgi:hypothetical protein